jgi:hypothetical protein
MRWTRGRHQFVVAAHDNTDNPHTHIFFNSVTLDHSRKFQDFKRSAIALRRVSDKLCLENGLSIVERPGLSKGYNRAEYLGDKKPPTGRGKLCELIDANLVVGNSLTEFITKLKRAGVEVKHGKQFSFRPPGSKKFFRQDTLGDDYSAEAILERLAGRRDVAKREASETDAERKAAAYAETRTQPNLLIDIQAKIQEGAGDAYVQWMKIFNLQTAARTLVFLKEQGIDSYDELKEKSSAVSGEFSRMSREIRDIEQRQKEISEMQKHIGNYGKGRAVNDRYKASGYDQNFYEEHRAALTLFKAAKDFFNERGIRKTPSINELKQEWARLDAEKRKLYAKYHAIKPRYKKLQTALVNAENMLGINKTSQHEWKAPRKSHDHDAR